MKKFGKFREDNRRRVTKRRRMNTGHELSSFQSRLIQRPIRHCGHKELKSVFDCDTSGGKMNTRKIIILASIGLALFMIVPTAPANAQGCYYCNPLLFPFAVAATVVGTAAAIATAPFCPYCGPQLLRSSPSGTRLLRCSPSTTRLLRRSPSGARPLRRPAISLQGMDSWTL